MIRIEVPPLKARKEDIPLLTGHFIEKCNRILGKSIHRIHPDVIRVLQDYNFPGNVRELENIIERAAILAETGTITVKELNMTPPIPEHSIQPITLEEVQKQTILAALKHWEGNRTRAAKALGIHRRTLLRKIKEYGFEKM